MDLKRLRQVITEDDFSKFNVNNMIRSVVSLETLMEIQSILAPWYNTKLLEEPLEDIALKVAVTLYSTGKSELLTTAAGKIATVFNLDTMEGVELSLDLLGVIDQESDLIDVYLSGSHLAYTTTLLLNKEVAAKVTQVSCLPPMICKPSRVTNTHNSGHLTISKSLILGKQNTKVVKQNLHYINCVNNTEMSINTVVLGYEEESKNKLNVKDRESFNNMVATSDKAYDYILKHGNMFYLTHNYDNRGRVYADNWMINYQSTDFKKAVCVLNKKELMT